MALNLFPWDSWFRRFWRLWQWWLLASYCGFWGRFQWKWVTYWCKALVLLSMNFLLFSNFIFFSFYNNVMLFTLSVFNHFLCMVMFAFLIHFQPLCRLLSILTLSTQMWEHITIWRLWAITRIKENLMLNLSRKGHSKISQYVCFLCFVYILLFFLMFF